MREPFEQLIARKPKDRFLIRNVSSLTQRRLLRDEALVDAPLILLLRVLPAVLCLIVLVGDAKLGGKHKTSIPDSKGNKAMEGPVNKKRQYSCDEMAMTKGNHSIYFQRFWVKNRQNR